LGSPATPGGASEDVAAAGRRVRGGGAALEAERRRRDDLGKAVDLARPRAADRSEPVAGRRQRGAAADGADLEPGEPNRGMEAPADAARGAVRHRRGPDHPEVLAGGG